MIIFIILYLLYKFQINYVIKYYDNGFPFVNSELVVTNYLKKWINLSLKEIWNS